MADRRAHAQERRRDRRIPVVARVRLEPVGGARIVLADLVDVSAGGLRVSCPLSFALDPGTELEVEISVQDGADARHPPLVNLRGKGRVVRLDERPATDTCLTALQFLGALRLREPFAQMLLF